MTARKSVRAVDVEARSSTNYPGALAERVRGRTKRALGNRFGLDQFGVNLTELAPGAHSALRHWHSAEDEFVYRVVYPDEDLMVVPDGTGKRRFVRKDATPI